MVKRCIAFIIQGVLSFVASFFDNNGCMLSYFLSKDCKYLLLYKLHVDYSKIYPSFVSIVLSLDKIY